VLDGDASGPARHVAVMTEVAPEYASDGRALIAASVPGPEALDAETPHAVRRQMHTWFGPVATTWTLLRTDVIAHGHPDQRPPWNPRRAVALGGARYVCGDHRDSASIQGALFSGRRAANAVARDLAG
jgi:hypothetical protein